MHHSPSPRHPYPHYCQAATEAPETEPWTCEYEVCKLAVLLDSNTLLRAMHLSFCDGAFRNCGMLGLVSALYLTTRDCYWSRSHEVGW